MSRDAETLQAYEADFARQASAEPCGKRCERCDRTFWPRYWFDFLCDRCSPEDDEPEELPGEGLETGEPVGSHNQDATYRP